MPRPTLLQRKYWGYPLLFLALPLFAEAQEPTPTTRAALGAPPPSAQVPKIRFAFEFRVTLAPAVVVGDTPFGHRQYIPITGGKIAGPSLNGDVLPGGWDYQLVLGNGCANLSADYFIRAEDGTVIHVLNEGMFCAPAAAGGPRSYFRPRFEAPKGAYDWLTRSTFVAALEPEPATPGPAGAAGPLPAIRLKFYQVE